jgi:hypothetical protein
MKLEAKAKAEGKEEQSFVKCISAESCFSPSLRSREAGAYLSVG